MKKAIALAIVAVAIGHDIKAVSPYTYEADRRTAYGFTADYAGGTYVFYDRLPGTFGQAAETVSVPFGQTADAEQADGKVDRIKGDFFYTKPHAFYQQCNEADSADQAEKNTAEWLKGLAEMTPDWTVYVDSESLYRSYPKDRRCQHVYTFGQPEDINWTRFDEERRTA